MSNQRQPSARKIEYKTFFEKVAEDSIQIVQRRFKQNLQDIMNLQLPLLKVPVGKIYKKISSGTEIEKKNSIQVIQKLNELCNNLCDQFEDFVKKLSHDFESNYNLHATPTYRSETKGTQGKSCPKESINRELLHEKSQPSQRTGQQNEYFKDNNELTFKSLDDFLAYNKRVVQVKHLNLNFNSLGLSDQNITHFIKVFYEYINLETLTIDLSSNSLTTASGHDLSHCLTNLKSLKYLDLIFYNNKIGADGFKSIADNLKKIPQLEELSMDVSSSNIGPKGFVYITQQIFDLKKLKKLWFKAYSIGIHDEAFKQFLTCLRQAPCYSVLTLDLRLNPFNKDLLKLFRKELANKKLNNYDIIV